MLGYGKKGIKVGRRKTAPADATRVHINRRLPKKSMKKTITKRPKKAKSRAMRSIPKPKM